MSKKIFMKRPNIIEMFKIISYNHMYKSQEEYATLDNGSNETLQFLNAEVF